SLSGPSALAFDATGNLWVVDQDNNDVYEYAAASLTGSGNVTAAPIVRVQTSDNMTGAYLAFDASGNLWVSDGNQRVVKFSSSQLTAGGASLTPATTITGSSGGYQGVAFDNSGNLWVADVANAQLVEFSTAQLTAGGSITPAVSVIVANGSSLDS